MSSLTIYTDEELKAIQKLALKVLKTVIATCEQLSIEYFLVAGTALGAIRHNGFIPWDDDIDIGMTREHYIRFLKEAPAILPKGYYIQSPYDKERPCPYSYSKVRLDGTKFVEYCNRNVNMHQGIYIDIFPFDEVPNDERLNKKQFDKLQLLKRLYYIHESPDISYEPVSLKDKIKFLIRRVCHYCLRIIPHDYFINKIEYESTKYNGTNQDALANLDYSKWKKMYTLKTTLYPLGRHKFEDIEANIPGKCDIYLKTQYGDYMKYPPKDQRFGHKPYIVDLGNNKV